MSSGYVSSNSLRVPEVTRAKSANPQIDLSAFNPRYKFRTDDLAWRNPITTFRSGPSYEREVSKPGAIFGEQNANEFLASINGDYGHEFICKKVTECHGNTYSRRPTALFAPYWDQLTRDQATTVQGTFANGVGINANTLYETAGENTGPNWSFVRSDSELVTMGTSFIKATNPIQSQVNLLSSIAEAVTSGIFLPELLGKQIVSSAISNAKRRDLVRATGSEYLNYIFGYKPLADDIAKTGILIDTVNGIIDQWIKDSGTIVRRRRRSIQPRKQLKSLSISASSMPAYGLLSLVPHAILGYSDPYNIGIAGAENLTNRANMRMDGLMTSWVDSEITFSAGYEYDLGQLYLPVAGGSAADLMHNAAVRNDLKKIAFGLDSGSISTALYDATPFSWLLDWFVNLGDVIDNFRGLQTRGVQMLWGYVTETAVRKNFLQQTLTYTPTNNVFFRSNGFFAQKAIRRIRATPFGFGTSFGSLSVSQSATLAALAASKSR